jgi:hypothetical protein
MTAASTFARVVVTAVIGGAAASVLAQAPRSPAGFPGAAPQGAPVTIRSLDVEPATIEPGQSATLRWEVLNAYSVSIEPAVGNVAARGTQRLSPAATTTYTLTATGANGTTSRSATVAVAGTVSHGATGTAAVAGPRPVPRLADGKPDLSGLYIAERGVRLVGEAALAPGAESFRVEFREGDLGTGIDCLPPGVPAAVMLPFPLQLVHKPDVVAIMYEAYHQFRIVPIGRDHAEYLPPAWMGHSVARWDGETLVVDVRGFNDKTIIAGHRHTEDLRVVERYRRSAYETIEYEATVEDPNVFAAPLRFAGTLTLHPEWEIGEYVCTENDQDYDALFENGGDSR